MLTSPFPIALLALLAPWTAASEDETPFITVASTTSTQNSGLFDHLLPAFRESSGIEVRVIAVGTGQAIRLAERGDCDVLLVHHRPSEEAFVEAGFGVARHDVMYNDFVLVGPTEDPAGVRGMSDVVGALERITTTRAPFASRGDDSGTHKRELELWKATDAKSAPKRDADWYRSTGSGMGATLNVADQLGAYTLADRGTWLSFENREHLDLLVEGDERLFNPYGVIVVNPDKHPHVKAAAAQTFVDWLLSDEGRARIEGFRVKDQPLFHPVKRAEPPAEPSHEGDKAAPIPGGGR